MESTRLAEFCVFLLFATCCSQAVPASEEDPGYWRSWAQSTLLNALHLHRNENVAKNIVFFLGDGMGITTITAARILKGQLENKNGEQTVLTFEAFPHVALSKTYNTDFQISDSASTATAILCGVKTNMNIVGISAAGRNGVCRSQKGNEVTSILKWAKDEGKSVGIVTTTRVQHGTPAAAYAHSASRKWYSDSDMPSSAKKDGCKDIAYQLVFNMDIDVVIGGGRKYMTPRGTRDPEYPNDLKSRGKRDDKLDLIAEWQMRRAGQAAYYVWNKEDFDRVDVNGTDALLALFEPGDLRYELERDSTMDPSLPEMTKKAISILQKNPKGFFLLVEGGRIDQGHHASQAAMALHETVMLDRAVEVALALTKEEDTLTVVSADHSHGFVFTGYPFRGSSILGKSNGKSPLFGRDNLPYTTLLYGNGPGYKVENNSRQDIRKMDTASKDYVQQSAVPVDSETHGGEDVAIFAHGPMAHLFHGVHEQNYIPHALAYAACIGENKNHCANVAARGPASIGRGTCSPTPPFSADRLSGVSVSTGFIVSSFTCMSYYTIYSINGPSHPCLSSVRTGESLKETSFVTH